MPFTSGSIGVFRPSGCHPQKVIATPSASFRNLVQHPEPERLMRRLHQLIDGRSGAAVGSVLMKCIQENWLSRNPTRAEFCGEFALAGTWSAIHNYLDENNENALAKANKVVIFE